jgi:uncharacterized protein
LPYGIVNLLPRIELSMTELSAAFRGRLPRAGLRAALILAVIVAELAVIGAVFQFAVDFDCRTVPGGFATCMFVRNFLGRGIAILTFFAIYVTARPRAFAFLWRDGARPSARPWPAVQLAGAALILSPVALAGRADFADIFLPSLVPWTIGALAAGFGALFWLAPPAAWRDFLARERALPWLVLAAGLAAPEAMALADRAWTWSPLTDTTFASAAWLLRLAAGTIHVDPGQYHIGLDGFVVEVAGPCSGAQGFALITALLLAYFWMHRDSLRFPQAFVLIPVGLLASFALNVVRIAALIWIGARVSPDLAVNGFHSHAGWLMFTLLSFALIGLSRAVPWFDRAPGARAPAPALLGDWNAALILPFVAFMLSGLVASTFAAVPGAWYPLRFAAMAAAVLAFAKLYRSLDWRPDPRAAAAGLGVGILWIATQPAAGEADAALEAALAAMGPAAFALWAASRILGTALLVPLIEEAFFRGYVLRRLDTGGALARLLALAVSSGLFALLHDRWLAAFLAGALFGALMLRRGRLADAVLAHGLANAVIAAWALAQDDWAVI